MNKKLRIGVMLMLLAQAASAVRIGLRFDDDGNFLNPDDYLVLAALEADKGGYKNDAMWRLVDAAEFGNKHAQYFIGLLHLQKKDNIMGLAWLKLAGKGISNNDQLMPALAAQMSPDDRQAADLKYEELKTIYNFETAIKKRAHWKKRLYFGGTHLRGHVPSGWRTFLPNGKMVFDHELRRELDEFIFEYRYDQGEVNLKDFEVIED